MIALTLQHPPLNGDYQMTDTDISYIAGLFDGEGSIDFKRRKEYRKNRKGEKYLCNVMNITMRIEMTHESILRWIKEKLKMQILVIYQTMIIAKEI